MRILNTVKLLVAIVVSSAFQTRSCAAQAQTVDEVGTTPVVHIRTAVDTSLPAGILAVTICDSTNQPLVVVRNAHPDQQVLVHEAVHVLQVERGGGRPGGWLKIVHDRISLVNAEAEATCVEAYWAEVHTGENHRKTINLTARSLWELSKWRAKGNGKEWELEPGEIAHAFNAYCPEPGEPTYTPGTTTMRAYPERKAITSSPLTGR